MLIPPSQQPITPAAPAAPARGKAARWLVHGSLFLAFAATVGAGVVWPQWVDYDGTRTAIESFREQQQELDDRLELLRAKNQNFRNWQQDGRRVFLSHEVTGYPVLARAVAKRLGATVMAAEVTSKPSPRWRSFGIQAGAWGTAEAAEAGEIQTRMVRVALTGDFTSVYRTMAALCQQQQLFIPDRWQIVASNPGNPAQPGTVRADVWATVFVLREQEEELPAPQPVRTPLAGQVAATPENRG